MNRVQSHYATKTKRNLVGQADAIRYRADKKKVKKWNSVSVIRAIRDGRR